MPPPALARFARAWLLALLAIAAGCSSREGSAPLTLALQTEPTTLDPALAVDFSSGRLASLIHSNLVSFDVDGAVVADLARRWEVSADRMTWTFSLGSARFSNGRRVVAADVALSMRRLLDPATASPRWWLLRDLAGAAEFHGGGVWNASAASASDDSTLVIRLARPVPSLLQLLAMPSAGVVCPEEAERLGPAYGRSPCGSGPWMLSRWAEGDEIALVPNPRFEGTPPACSGILFRIIPEQMTAIAEFEVGSLDILEVPRAELEMWRTAGPPLLSREELRVVYIGLNTSRPPLDDARVRRALNCAVDVDAIIARVLFGGGRRARGVVPGPLRRTPAPPERYPYDPARARRLLAEAGHPDGISIEIWQRENPEAGRILESVQGYLAAVGVTARIVTREWGALKQAIDQGSPDAYYLDWYADYPEAENFLVPLFHSSNIGGGGNRSRYRSAPVDSLLDEAGRTIDADARWELYRAAEETIYDDAPWIFLWFPIQYEVLSPRVVGYRMPVIFNGQRYTGVALRGR